MLEIQKVLHLHKELAKKNPQLQGNYLLSEKMDGIYTYIDYHPKIGFSLVKSSAQREIPALAWTKKLFESLPKPKEPCRFIQEATIPGVDFHTANGIFNRSVGDFVCQDVVFHIHDIVFPERLGLATALERYNILKTLDISNTMEKLQIHPILYAGSYDEYLWMKYFNEITEKGGEGIVAKRENSLYTPGKRNSDLLKIKLEETFDLLCTRYFTTLGEKGNIAYNVELKNKKGVLVNARIGKFDDIAEFNINSPVGKVIEIKAMCELPDGSYREPRFYRLRTDKNPSEID